MTTSLSFILFDPATFLASKRPSSFSLSRSLVHFPFCSILSELLSTCWDGLAATVAAFLILGRWLVDYLPNVLSSRPCFLAFLFIECLDWMVIMLLDLTCFSVAMALFLPGIRVFIGFRQIQVHFVVYYKIVN